MVDKKTKQSLEELNKKNNTLGDTLKGSQERLQEMQETLEAIINGAVDGIVRHTPKGNQIFMLKGSEEPYRNLIEEMEEGAVLLSSAGTILYCNGGFAKLVDAPLDSIMSKNIACWVSESSSNTFADLLLKVKGGVGKGKFDIVFQTADKRLIPTQVSLTRISMSSVNASALIITDLTKHMEEEVKRYTANLEREIADRKKAEERLRETEVRLSAITENSRDGINLLDLKTGKYVYMNPAQVALTGFTFKEINNISAEEAYDRTHPDDRQITIEQQKKIAAGEDTPEPVEYRWKVKSGEYRWFSDSCKLIRDKDDNPIAMVGTSRDITELKKTEEALRNLMQQTDFDRKRLESILETSPSAIVIVEAPDGRFSLVNKRAQELYGIDFRGVDLATNVAKVKASRPDGTAYDVDDVPASRALRLGEEVRNEEMTICRADGNAIPVFVSAGPIRDAQGNIAAAIVIFEDVTEAKKAEEELKQLNEELEQRVQKRTADLSAERKRLFDVLETIPAMVCLLTPDHHVIFANRKFREKFGESEGRHCYDYCFGNKGPCDFCESYNVLETGQPHHWQVTGRDGSIIDAYDYPFTDTDGSSLILEMDIDITDRVRMEKQLKDSERLAAIGATAGMVGHDIRNPLQAITSDVYLAKTELAQMIESEEKKNALESLTEIEKNIDYINKIVQDLQDYSRPINPKVEESDLRQIVESLFAKNHLPENVEVNVEVAEDTRKIKVDAYYLNRILFNLATNAVQAMPQGGKLTIGAHKEENDTVIIISDTGVGIPKAIQDKMFTLMFTTKSKGQGFGLPVVKRMTESLGGTVSFESQEGKGTTFTVRLPPPQRTKR